MINLYPAHITLLETSRQRGRLRKVDTFVIWHQHWHKEKWKLLMSFPTTLLGLFTLCKSTFNLYDMKVKSKERRNWCLDIFTFDAIIHHCRVCGLRTLLLPLQLVLDESNRFRAGKGLSMKFIKFIFRKLNDAESTRPFVVLTTGIMNITTINLLRLIPERTRASSAILSGKLNYSAGAFVTDFNLAIGLTKI